MQTDLRGTELYKRMQQADGHWLQLGSGRTPDLYDIALSPDGKTLAYLSDRDEPGITQLCLMDLATIHPARDCRQSCYNRPIEGRL